MATQERSPGTHLSAASDQTPPRPPQCLPGCSQHALGCGSLLVRTPMPQPGFQGELSEGEAGLGRRLGLDWSPGNCRCWGCGRGPYHRRESGQSS